MSFLASTLQKVPSGRHYDASAFPLRGYRQKGDNYYVQDPLDSFSGPLETSYPNVSPQDVLQALSQLDPKRLRAIQAVLQLDPKRLSEVLALISNAANVRAVPESSRVDEFLNKRRSAKSPFHRSAEGDYYSHGTEWLNKASEKSRQKAGTTANGAAKPALNRGIIMKVSIPPKKASPIAEVLDRPNSYALEDEGAQDDAVKADANYFSSAWEPIDPEKLGTKKAHQFLSENERGQQHLDRHIKALNQMRETRSKEREAFDQINLQDGIPQKKKLKKRKKLEKFIEGQEKGFQKQYVQKGQKEAQKIYNKEKKKEAKEKKKEKKASGNEGSTAS